MVFYFAVELYHYKNAYAVYSSHMLSCMRRNRAFSRWIGYSIEYKYPDIPHKHVSSDETIGDMVTKLTSVCRLDFFFSNIIGQIKER